MFLRNSRYFGLATVIERDRSGRPVAAVKLRRLPTTDGDDHLVQGHDRLDAMSENLYRNATRYWHVADANTELKADALTARAGRLIKVPPR